MSRKEELKELFSFTSGEIKGIRVLILIIVIIMGSRIYFDLTSEEYIEDNTAFLKEIEEFNAGLIPIDDQTYENRLDKYILQRYDSLKLFNFDPNTTTHAQFIELGLTEKQIETIQKYISRGGKYYDKQDFQRTYGIRQKQYEILKPYISLPEKSSYSKNNYDYYENDNYKQYEKNKYLNYKDSSLYFNPNKSNAQNWLNLNFSEKQTEIIMKYFQNGGVIYQKEDLLNIFCIDEEKLNEIKSFIIIETQKDKLAQEIIKIPDQIDLNLYSEDEFYSFGGFWKFNAAKIVKYREMLGGFYKKEQLLEIYGMKKEYYYKITQTVTADKSKIKKININFAEAEELSKHPYIKYHNANAIIEFRNTNGAFTDIHQLRDSKILSQTIFDKLKIYLTVK